MKAPIKYRRLIPANMRPKLIEVPLEKRLKTTVINKAVEKESEALFKKLIQTIVLSCSMFWEAK